jgi:hypothetical protein
MTASTVAVIQKPPCGRPAEGLLDELELVEPEAVLAGDPAVVEDTTVLVPSVLKTLT